MRLQIETVEWCRDGGRAPRMADTRLDSTRPLSAAISSMQTMQWRNYERRSEAIASGRQAAGGAFGRRIVCFALQTSAEFLKKERH